MSSQTIFLTAGATSKSVDVMLVQKAAATSPGDPLTGLAYNTASLKAYYRKNGTGTPTAITLATLANAQAAWSSGGFVEVDATNMPGLYRLDIPDTVQAAIGEANIVISGAANLAPHVLKIIVTDMDFYDRAVNFRKATTEAYSAVGAAATPEQLLNEISSFLQNRTEAGTLLTVKKRDNTTVAMTYTYDATTATTIALTSAA
jgi:hypothetical protein